MKKKANIAFTVLIALIVICAGTAIFSIASTGRYNAMTEYKRMSNRYIAESGVDLSVGLLINYLDNRELTISYEADEDGNYSVMDAYSPYIFSEAEDADEDEDNVLIDIVSSEARDYLKSIGYFDFKKSDSIKVYVSTNGDKENLKLTNLCSTPDFLVSYGNDTGKSNKSLLNPIFVTVKTDYPGGNILCNVKLSNIYIKRGEFEETQPGEMGNVTAFLDTSEIKTEYINYQNYGGGNE